MFDIGWSEILVVAVLAIIVIGPKDLPRVMRTAGRLVRKARLMAAEFQESLEQMAQEAELEEVKKSIHHVSNYNIKKALEETADPDGSLARMTTGFTEPPVVKPMVPTSPESQGASTSQVAESSSIPETAAPAANVVAEPSKPRRRTTKTATTAKPAAKAGPAKEAKPAKTTKPRASRAAKTAAKAAGDSVEK